MPSPLPHIAYAVRCATGVNIADQKAIDRSRSYVAARQLAWYLALQEGYSKAEIARYWQRDHSSVIKGISRIEEMPQKAAMPKLAAIRLHLERIDREGVPDWVR